MSCDRPSIDRPVPRTGDQLSTLQRIRDIVAGILAARACPTVFSDDDTLAEIGITSVDMVTLLLAVESEFNIEVKQCEITPDVFRSISTIDALIWRSLPLPTAGATWRNDVPEDRKLCANVAG